MLYRLMGNSVEANCVNCGMTQKWNATFVQEFHDSVELIGNSVETNHMNRRMPQKWRATLVQEFLDRVEEFVCVSDTVTIP